MTQNERWQLNYEEVVQFVKTNCRNLSKYEMSERRLYTWMKHQRKVMNAGKMKEERVEKFKELLEIGEQYKRVNQWK